MDKKKVLSYISKLIFIIYLVSIVYFIFFNKVESIVFALASLIGTVILIYLNKKFDKLFDTSLIITLVIFIFFAGLLGSSFRFYDNIKNYDDFLHIWSGFIACSGAYVLFNCFANMEINSRERKIFFVIYMFMFSMGVASIWELIEFFSDQVFHTNCQVGSLVDTMMDMFDCFIGSIIMISCYAKHLPKYEEENLENQR